MDQVLQEDQSRTYLTGPSRFRPADKTSDQTRFQTSWTVSSQDRAGLKRSSRSESLWWSSWTRGSVLLISNCLTCCRFQPTQPFFMVLENRDDPHQGPDVPLPWKREPCVIRFDRIKHLRLVLVHVSHARLREGGPLMSQETDQIWASAANSRNKGDRKRNSFRFWPNQQQRFS